MNIKTEVIYELLKVLNTLQQKQHEKIQSKYII